MSPALILICIAGYFAFLLLIAWVTSRNATNAAYFLGNKVSPWYAVAFGMIGDSLSGVTFISVPGWVGARQFSYLQMVLGYVVGYAVIAGVLLPLYYRLNLTSIYSYLGQRFGPNAQKTGSAFFLLSRTLGAAARLYLAAGVIHAFVFEAWGVPFALTVAVIIGLMLVYTFRGGIKTLVWTDTFQSTFLLLGVLLSIVAIARELNLGAAGLVSALADSAHTQVFFWAWLDDKNFWKQFIGGAFVAVCMTGLDQNMMQKNLSCRSLADARKNILWFSGVVVIVNILFLSLGALLYQYAELKGIAIPRNTDQLFPLLALQHLGKLAAVVFVIGLTAATFSSADSVLTTLTTSFCIDILGMDRTAGWTEQRKTQLRHRTHLVFAVVLLGAILVFQAAGSPAVIQLVLKLANYTYGPLLGLFAFGLFCHTPVRDRCVPFICLLSPAVCYVLDERSAVWLGGYRFGNELLVVNGLLTCLGLFLVRRSE
ncbi:MAG TPA: sodium:solute symporter [Verrucomicrobiae bacterium]|nr:sodium:solute symporter [Verrucomicrobiae bacterium]